MQIEFVSVPVEKDLIGAVGAFAFEGELSPAAAALDAAAGGAVSRAVSSGRFKGAKGQTLDLVAPAGVAAQRIVIVGLGAKSEVNAAGIEAAAAHAYNAVKTSGSESLALYTHDGASDSVAHAALGVRLAAYRFDRYRTKDAGDKAPSVAVVRLVAADPDQAAKAYEPYAALADGVTFARDLVSEPPNIMSPAEFARRAEMLAGEMTVEVLSEAAMQDLGMGLLLAVGRGSAQESKLVVMRWLGGEASEPPIALVGKGICFDTGGLWMKGGPDMWPMRGDMAGAAAVAGAMLTISQQRVRRNVVGILALAENAVDANAYRPSDIVRSMSGQMVEITNTDAEGRLVLADALTYAQQKLNARTIVDVATLTGAVRVALGFRLAGLFANDDALADRVLAAGRAADEEAWRLPMGAEYEKYLESEFADFTNAPLSGQGIPGSAVAAAFLSKFIEPDVRWAHLDIAGTAFASPVKNPLAPTWASGWGVRILSELAKT